MKNIILFYILILNIISYFRLMRLNMSINDFLFLFLKNDFHNIFKSSINF